MHLGRPHSQPSSALPRRSHLLRARSQDLPLARVGARAAGGALLRTHLPRLGGASGSACSPGGVAAPGRLVSSWSAVLRSEERRVGKGGRWGGGAGCSGGEEGE